MRVSRLWISMIHRSWLYVGDALSVVIHEVCASTWHMVGPACPMGLHECRWSSRSILHFAPLYAFRYRRSAVLIH